MRKLGDNVKSRLRLFMPLFLFARRFVASGLLTVWILGNAGLGQPVTVQIVNGRNGKPMAKVRVYIGFDDLRGRQPLDLTTNRQGEIQFEADGAQTFQVHPVGTVACGEQQGAGNVASAVAASPCATSRYRPRSATGTSPHPAPAAPPLNPLTFTSSLNQWTYCRKFR